MTCEIKYQSFSFAKYLLILIALISIVFPSCNTTSSPEFSYSEDEEDRLLETVEKFNLAFRECDIEQLKTLITENYLHTNGNTKSIGKIDWLAYLERRKMEIERGDLIVNSYGMEEIEVERYGSMAIVTGKVVVSSTISGEREESEYRITNVWVIEDGDWKRAGFHDGRIR